MKNYTQLLSFLLIFTFSGATYAQTYSWSYEGEHTWWMGRYDHAMAYIGEDKILMFGGHAGGHLDDTSVYDLSSNHWQQFTGLTTRPSFRYRHAMAYIGDDKVLLFGGYHNIEGVRGDTWLFDLSDQNWTLLTPALSPSVRFGHTMVYMDDDKVLLFGGNAGGDNFNNETWIFDLSDGTWVKMEPITSPSARFSHSMAKIGDQKAVLFGGVASISGGGAPQGNQETWMYDLGTNTWILMNSVLKPWPRYAHAMAYLGGDSAILYGGYNISSPNPILSDTWIYDLSDDAWLEHSGTFNPPAMWLHALAETDVDRGDIVLFGGAENFTLSEMSQETWVFERLDVYIPDANFEKALIDLGIDSDGTINQSVLTSDISGVTSLDLSSKGISNLTGIEDFTNLEYLYCRSNQLTSLDISKNINLTELYCYENQLTSLDLSQNSALEILYCGSNNLSSLDVSKNLNLRDLHCYNNQLTNIDVSLNTSLERLYIQVNNFNSLDISKNINLTDLHCNNNQFTTLDISKNTALENLYSGYNNITNIDISKNLNLRDLVIPSTQISNIDVHQHLSLGTLICSNTQITSLDLSNNTNLNYLACQLNSLTRLNVKNGNNSNIDFFFADNNPSLTCIQVDDVAYSTASWTSIDPWANFSEDCGYALGIDDEILAQGLSLYPNPVSTILNIDSEIPLTKVEVYSMLGKKVKEIKSDFKSIPADNLSNGVYIIRIHSENGLATKKLIKR